MTTELATPSRSSFSIVLPGGFFSVYAAWLILLSFVWPRYTLLPGINVSPYSLAALLGWVAIPSLLLLKPTFRRRLLQASSGKGLIIGFLVAWFGWRLFSSSLGPDPSFSVNEALRDILFMLPLLPATMMIMTLPDGPRTMMRIVIVATVVAIVVALLERATEQTVGQIFGLGFSGNASFASEAMIPSYRGGQLRTKSTFVHSIVFAQYLAWSAPLLLASFAVRIGRIYRVAALAALALLPAAIGFTGSRSGIIAMIASVSIYFVILALQRMRLSVGAGMAVLTIVSAVGFLVAGASQEIFQDLVNGRDSAEFNSTLVRIKMLEIGLSNVGHSPFIGYGDGRAALYAGHFTGERGTFATIDNYYLSSLLNNGYIGFLIMLVGWALLLFKSILVALRYRRLIDSAIAAGIVAMLLTFSIVSLTDGLTFLLISAAMLFAPAKGGNPSPGPLRGDVIGVDAGHVTRVS